MLIPWRVLIGMFFLGGFHVHTNNFLGLNEVLEFGEMEVDIHVLGLGVLAAA